MATKCLSEESFPPEEKEVSINDHLVTGSDEGNIDVTSNDHPVTATDEGDVDLTSNDGDDDSQTAKVTRNRAKDEYDICVGYHAEDATIPVYARGSEQNTIRYRTFHKELKETVSPELANLISKRPAISKSNVVFDAKKFDDYKEIDLTQFGKLDEMTDAQKTELAKLVIYAGEDDKETEMMITKATLAGMTFTADGSLRVGTYKHDSSVPIFAFLKTTTNLPMLKFRANAADIKRSSFEIQKYVKFESILIKDKFRLGREQADERTKKYIRAILVFDSDHRM